MHNNEGIQKEILITLHETPGIGWQTIRKAVEYGAWHSYERYTPDAWISSVGLVLNKPMLYLKHISRQDICRTKQAYVKSRDHSYYAV